VWPERVPSSPLGSSGEDFPAFTSGRFGQRSPGRQALPGRSPDLAHPDHPCGTPCVCPSRWCGRTRWLCTDAGTPCGGVSGQDAGQEYGEERHTHTTNSGTWKEPRDGPSGWLRARTVCAPRSGGGNEDRCSGPSEPEQAETRNRTSGHPAGDREKAGTECEGLRAERRRRRSGRLGRDPRGTIMEGSRWCCFRVAHVRKGGASIGDR
jgi:hypothetical protein